MAQFCVAKKNENIHQMEKKNQGREQFIYYPCFFAKNNDYIWHIKPFMLIYVYAYTHCVFFV